MRIHGIRVKNDPSLMPRREHSLLKRECSTPEESNLTARTFLFFRLSLWTM